MKKQRAKKKVGHSESTQRWVDTKCPISWKTLIVLCLEKHQNITSVWPFLRYLKSSIFLSTNLRIIIFSSILKGLPLGREVYLGTFFRGPKSLNLVSLIVLIRSLCSSIFNCALAFRAQTLQELPFFSEVCRFKPNSDIKITSQWGHFLENEVEINYKKDDQHVWKNI